MNVMLPPTSQQFARTHLHDHSRSLSTALHLNNNILSRVQLLLSQK